jgi:hypothetical protein
MIRVTAKAENEVTYDDSFSVGGMTPETARNLIMTDLTNSGWQVTANGTNGIIITGRQAGSPIKHVDMGNNNLWVTSSPDGNCTTSEALPGDKKWKFAMAWPPTDPTNPGALAMTINSYHVFTNLPANAPPSLCAQLLMQSMMQAGFITTLQGDTVVLDWENPINQTMLGAQVYTTIEDQNSAGGPHVMIGIPTSLPQNLDVTLTPINPPIVVPSSGGSFSFDAAVVNQGPTPGAFTVWARIKYPTGYLPPYTPPTLGPVQINPPLNVVVQRLRFQNIPGTWPPGMYTYLGYANWTFSYPAVDSSAFTFMKSNMADGNPTVWDERCYGEPFPGEEWMVSLPASFSLASVHPNPFNPSTTINFTLPQAGHVSLAIYDLTGRLVIELVNGHREGGVHEVTFDGSHLASGVYLYTLSAGQNHATGKMVLLK